MSFLINSYRFGVTEYPSGAVFAYGLRELPGFGYTGALIRVRRESDNVESDFFQGASAGDLNTTRGGGGTDIASWVGASNGRVVTWYDQDGSNNATQSSAGSQPLIVSSGTLLTRGGKPCMQFSSSRMDTSNGLFNSVQHYVAFFVGYASGAGGSSVPTIHTAYTSGGYKCAIVYDFTTAQRYQVGGRRSSADGFLSTIGTTNLLTTQSVIVGALDYSAATAKIYYNSTLENTNNSFHSGTTDSTSNALFNDSIGGYASANNNYEGEMQELVVYSSNVHSEIVFVSDVVKTYYGL